MDNCKTVKNNRITVCLSNEDYESVKLYMEENDCETLSNAIRKIVREKFRSE